VDEDVSPWADAGVEPDAGRPADEAERRQSVASADCGHPDERRWGPLLRSGSFLRGAPGGVRYLAALVWLLFVIFPVLNAIGKHGSPLSHGLIIGGAALFVATYATLVMRWRSGESPRVSLALTVLLLALATGLTLTQASGWGFLFTYCAACVAILAPRGAGFYGVALCSILAAVTSAIAGADGGTVLGFVASSAGIGLLMLVMSDLRLRNQQLSDARAELARMAVAQERERFARDLHDLLGHSLSVIALKAELAGRMLSAGPGEEASEPEVLERAATEVRELEQVARTALGEVRDAVSGYRQPTLAGELAGARMALSAAGIEADVHETVVPLSPDVEAVLAWTVREGATNVIRHSGARHCTLRISAGLPDAGVEVVDDGLGTGARVSPVTTRDESGVPEPVGVGAGAAHAEGSASGAANAAGAASAASPAPASAALAGKGGHGLAGLAERARLLSGTLEAGALAGGGYRLAVTVPVSHA
jgi:two-component system, NarL family, sensor histidine kinase DesK